MILPYSTCLVHIVFNKNSFGPNSNSSSLCYYSFFVFIFISVSVCWFLFVYLESLKIDYNIIWFFCASRWYNHHQPNGLYVCSFLLLWEPSSVLYYKFTYYWKWSKTQTTMNVWSCNKTIIKHDEWIAKLNLITCSSNKMGSNNALITAWSTWLSVGFQLFWKPVFRHAAFF